MTTQSQVLEIVNKTGVYSASLYKFKRSTRGLNEINPAKKLTEKGQLKLINEEKEVFEDGEVIHYTWTKSTSSDDRSYQNAKINHRGSGRKKQERSKVTD
jgi:hypothetical protein